MNAQQNSQGSAVVTMASVQERVKSRIQETFMDLLPPELFESLVKQALHDFTKNDLPKLVKAAAEDRLKKLLREEFEKPEWRDTWTGDSAWKPSEMLGQVLRDAAPDMVAAMFGGVAVQMVQQLRNMNPGRF
jgi:hypothetical protein